MKKKTRDALFGRPEDEYSTDVKVAQNILNRTEDNLAFRDGSLTGRASNSVLAAGAASASCLGGAASSAYEGAWDRGEAFNEWAQGISDPETGIYPYTRDDKVS